MNNLEFITAMKKNGSENLKINKEGEIVYLYNGLNIVFENNMGLSLFGNIPYEVALIIFKNYPELRKEMKASINRINTKEGLNNSRKLTKNNQYVIDGYSVFSSRALIVLLTELKYYHQYGIYTEELRKKFKRQQEEIMASYNKAVVEVHKEVLGYKFSEWLDRNLEGYIPNFMMEVFPYIDELSKNMNPLANEDFNISSLEGMNPELEYRFVNNSYTKRDIGIVLKGKNETKSRCIVDIDEEHGCIINKFEFNNDAGEFVQIINIAEKNYGYKTRLNVFDKDGYEEIDVAYNFETGQIEEYDKENKPISRDHIELLKMYLEQANMRAKQDIADKKSIKSKKKKH